MKKVSKQMEMNILINRDDFVADKEMKEQYFFREVPDSNICEEHEHISISKAIKCMKFEDFIKNKNE